jgi:hypothetical protein
MDPDGVGPFAYGPKLTYKLAQRNLNQGGGASRASANADSYAWSVNSKYFFGLTGYFPPPSNYNARTVDDLDAQDEAGAEEGWRLYLGDIHKDTSGDEIEERKIAGVGAKPKPEPSSWACVE